MVILIAFQKIQFTNQSTFYDLNTRMFRKEGFDDLMINMTHKKYLEEIKEGVMKHLTNLFVINYPH